MKKISRYILLFAFAIAFHSAKAQTFSELSDSLLHYYQQEKFDKAAPFAEKLIVIVRQRFGTENAVYAKYLGLLSTIYVGAFQYPKAEQVILEMNAVNKKLTGTDTKEYNQGISLLAIVYNSMGRDDKALPYLAEAMEYERKISDTSEAFISAANRLAKVHESLQEYEQAATIFKNSIARLEASGNKGSTYATSLNNLGLIYNSMGHPEKAEPIMLKAMEVRKNLGGEESNDVANSLNNLASLYSDLGQHAKADLYYTKAASIFKKTKGENSTEYIVCLTNLGSEKDQLSDSEKAQEILQRAMFLADKNYDESWPHRLIILKDLGQLYLSNQQYSKAEPFLLKVAEIERSKNDSGERYAGALNDLAYLYTYTGKAQLAEEIYIRAAGLKKARLGNKHIEYASVISNLATFYMRNGSYRQAIPLLSEVNTITEQNLVNSFSILSAEEKMNYAASNVFLQETNLSILYNYPAAPASFYKENYDIQLLIKSLLLNENKNVLDAIRSSKDTLTGNKMIQWQKNKSILAKEYSLPEENRRKDLASFEEQTQSLEKELIRISSSFRNMRTGIDVKAEDVQAKLSADEAAIEFVDFRLLTKDISDSVMYGALILKNGSPVPVFVPLFEEKDLVKLIGNKQSTSQVLVNRLYPGTVKEKTDSLPVSRKLYRMIWQPLEQYLSGIKKIAYSPAGKLNSISFRSLAVDSSSLLMDRYQLNQYTSTRELLWRDDATTKMPVNAVFFGDPDFSLDSNQLIKIKKVSKENRSTTLYTPSKEEMNTGGWPALGGTAKEVKEIKKLFDGNKISSQVFTGLAASEENLKNLDGRAPQVLFIGTHGFFMPEKKTKSNSSSLSGANVLASSGNPLLRSGLVLSGGNYVWNGNSPIEGVEDGIVTAYEISQLDLRNTDLVVLSACETGLGDIKGTEGVFGLQRAFKLAGAKKMIVSLWKVPDKETSELMIAFYDQWLKGNTIENAFSMAQSIMRKKYPPYYWAAFLLVQ